MRKESKITIHPTIKISTLYFLDDMAKQQGGTIGNVIDKVVSALAKTPEQSLESQSSCHQPNRS